MERSIENNLSKIQYIDYMALLDIAVKSFNEK